MKVINNPEGCTDNSQTPSGGSSAVSINFSGAALVVFASVIGGVVLAAAFVACFLSAAAYIASQNATAAVERQMHEAKQIEIQLMYTNALMIREGMVRQGDMVFGPEGNLEYDGHKFIKPKEKK